MRKIEAMHHHYGKTGGICKNCCNFDMYQCSGKRVSKCTAYGLSHSEASDWSGRHQACGKYNVPFDNEKETPLIVVLKRGKRETEDIPCENQIGLEV